MKTEYKYPSIGDDNQPRDKYGLTPARIELAQADEEFESVIILSLNDNSIQLSDNGGYSPPVMPHAEDFTFPANAELYGKGFGYSIRGLKINGTLIYYKTEAEALKEGHDELYGADLTEYLKRWDEGKTVWSISMGGMGPGYEQAIQTLFIEMLRSVSELWPVLGTIDMQDAAVKKEFDSVTKVIATELDNESWAGFSGAQVGAARNLAYHFAQKGMHEILNDREMKSRRIQINNMHKFKRKVIAFTEYNDRLLRLRELSQNLSNKETPEMNAGPLVEWAIQMLNTHVPADKKV